MCLQVSPGTHTGESLWVSARSPSYPISGERLCPVLVDDPNVSWRLDPGLSVHLHRYALIPQDGNLHRATLRKHHSCDSCAALNQGAKVLDLSPAGAFLSHTPLHKPADIWGDAVPTANHHRGQSIPVQGTAHEAQGSVPPHHPLTQHGICDRSETSVVRHEHQAQGGDSRPARATGPCSSANTPRTG